MTMFNKIMMASFILSFWINDLSATPLALQANFPPQGFGKINEWDCVKGPLVYCVAVGYKEKNGKTIPLLVTTTDGVATWQEQSLPIPNGELISVSCATDGSICIALGTNENKNFLLQNTDHLKTWELKEIPNGNYSNLQFKIANCTGTNDPFCFIAGTHENGLKPMIVQSQDKGTTWQIYDVLDQCLAKFPNQFFCKSNIPRKRAGKIYANSCAGSGDQSTCIFYGEALNPNTGQPFTYTVRTKNKGDVWEYLVNS